MSRDSLRSDQSVPEYEQVLDIVYQEMVEFQNGMKGKMEEFKSEHDNILSFAKQQMLKLQEAMQIQMDSFFVSLTHAIGELNRLHSNPSEEEEWFEIDPNVTIDTIEGTTMETEDPLKDSSSDVTNETVDRGRVEDDLDEDGTDQRAEDAELSSGKMKQRKDRLNAEKRHLTQHSDEVAEQQAACASEQQKDADAGKFADAVQKVNDDDKENLPENIQNQEPGSVGQTSERQVKSMVFRGSQFNRPRPSRYECCYRCGSQSHFRSSCPLEATSDEPSPNQNAEDPPQASGGQEAEADADQRTTQDSESPQTVSANPSRNRRRRRNGRRRM